MELEKLVVGIPDTYVLPWYDPASSGHIVSGSTDPIEIDWSNSAEDLQSATKCINVWVGKVETNDPWVDTTFGIKGTGEGLVFYPVSEPHLGYNNFKNLVFKAKGERHKNIKTAAAAQVNPEAAANVNQFVDMVLAEARLEQGVAAVQNDPGVVTSTYDVKLVGKFIAWIVADVKKETKDELLASNLDWKDVQKPISDKARSWYLAKARV